MARARGGLEARPVRVQASGGQDVNHLDERYGDETPDILDVFNECGQSTKEVVRQRGRASLGIASVQRAA